MRGRSYSAAVSVKHLAQSAYQGPHMYSTVSYLYGTVESRIIEQCAMSSRIPYLGKDVNRTKA